MALRQRLIRDIAEMQAMPYPNVMLLVNDEKMTDACLVFTPEGEKPLHLTIEFGPDYPLTPPGITIQSRVNHPNVVGNYICASIFNPYTPAYTLKGISIQLLSFFSSDYVEQDDGPAIDRVNYRRPRYSPLHDNRGTKACFRCSACGFGTVGSRAGLTPYKQWTNSQKVERDSGRSPERNTTTATKEHDLKTPKDTFTDTPRLLAETFIAILPNELLIMICNHLEVEELTVFAMAWKKIGQLMQYEIIRARELQCFCLKQNFTRVQLGIGVNVSRCGKEGTLESEFDLVSLEAFRDLKIRQSVQGLPFEHWLPLPISRRHWNKVEDEVITRLSILSADAKLGCPPVDVIYHFMTDVVVKFSHEASHSIGTCDSFLWGHDDRVRKTTLSHASEKAIESYFHLFHLLLCMATSYPRTVERANKMIKSFLAGRTSKDSCPNLGHLLLALLVSNIEMTQPLVKAIIKEAIIRNVVWMLDARGAGMAELSYMEPSAVSEYRLQKTFEASKTSYRLLMFSNVFRRTTKSSSKARKSLVQQRENIFDAHGAPPKGAAAKLANEIKRIHAVDNFPHFLKAMGLQAMPTRETFTAFLRKTVIESVAKGYSVWGLSQKKALRLRREKEPGVEVVMGMVPFQRTSWGSFFPK